MAFRNNALSIEQNSDVGCITAVVRRSYRETLLGRREFLLWRADLQYCFLSSTPFRTRACGAGRHSECNNYRTRQNESITIKSWSYRQSSLSFDSALPSRNTNSFKQLDVTLYKTAHLLLDRYLYLMCGLSSAWDDRNPRRNRSVSHPAPVKTSHLDKVQAPIK